MTIRSFTRTTLAISCVLAAVASTSVVAQPWPDDPVPGRMVKKAKKAKVMSLPPMGDTSQCAATFVDGAAYFPNRTCMDTKYEFAELGLHRGQLRGKCPAGQSLMGMYEISCVHRLGNGVLEGAAYTATACCGVRVATTYAAPARQINMGYRGEMNGAPCPQLGVALPRTASSRVPFLAMRMTAMDKGCGRDGAGSRMSWVTFDSCAPEFDGRREQTRVVSRVTCGQ